MIGLYEESSNNNYYLFASKLMKLNDQGISSLAGAGT